MDGRFLAKCKEFDVGIEDHGLLVLMGHFEYEEGGVQGLGYAIDGPFIHAFLGALGVDQLKKVENKSCWVTVIDGTIKIIEPLHKKDGKKFDIREWVEAHKKKNSGK